MKIKKILHICSHKTGGAYYVAKILNSEINSINGFYSKIITLEEKDNYKKWINRLLRRYHLSSYTLNKDYQFSPHYNFDFTKDIQVLKKFDLIHVHWSNSGMINISSLCELNIPIVWTLHDWWILTGGCHVPIKCSKYLENCGFCPALNSKSKFDLSFKEQKLKFKTFKKFHFIAPSSKIFNEAKTIGIEKLKLIHNPFISKISTRSSKIKSNYIVFSAVNGEFDYNKGFNLLLSSMKLLKDLNLKLLILGFDYKKKQDFEYESFGYIDCRKTYEQIIINSKMVVVPSYYETFSLVAMEALAFGVPVICSKDLGASEFITHKKNGFIFKKHDAKRLAKGIRFFSNKIIQDSERFNYNNNSIKKYIETYSRIISI